MANVNPARLHERFVRTFAQLSLREPSCSTPYRLPVVWIRNIRSTARANEQNFTVTFGAENDAVIAPHLKKLRDQKIKAISRWTGNFNNQHEVGRTTHEAPRAQDLEISNVDDFEIEDFVDLSAKGSQNFMTRGDVYSRVKDVTEADRTEESNHTSSRRRKTSCDNFVEIEGPRPYNSRRPRDEMKTTRSISGSTPAWTPKNQEQWQIQKNVLREKFGEDGWNPRKKLSPDAIDGIRSLHEQDPQKYTTALLSSQFKVSPEAIRRMLKSKWSQTISPEKAQERRERWARRHDRIWDRQAELGLRPQRTKDKEVEDPDVFEKDLARRRALVEIND